MSAYPLSKVIAVDVDNTLIDASGVVVPAVVEYVQRKREEGFKVILWSMRGHAHALKAAEQCQRDLFDFIVPKPGVIIDDAGWSWIKYTKVVRPLEIAGGQNEGDDQDA